MKARAKQRGVVAVELALSMVFLLFMVAPFVLFGRLLWYYGVMKSASAHAARIVAAAPPYTFRVATTRNALIATAREAALNSARSAGLQPSRIGEETIGIHCDNAACSSGAPPQVVRVNFEVRYTDPLFFKSTMVYTDSVNEILLLASTEVPYSGAVPVHAMGAP